MYGVPIEKPKEKFDKISVVLPKNWAEFLREKSKRQDVSMSKIIKTALQNFYLGELK